MKVLCQYCGGKAEFVDSKVIYGRSYGMAYYCKPCDAYVGVHKGTNKPKGTLANAELREARKIAHKVFDWYWIEGKLNRFQVYKRLSIILGLKVEDCHIGMFNQFLCESVVLACEYDLLSTESKKLSPGTGIRDYSLNETEIPF